MHGRVSQALLLESLLASEGSIADLTLERWNVNREVSEMLRQSRVAAEMTAVCCTLKGMRR